MNNNNNHILMQQIEKDYNGEQTLLNVECIACVAV